MVALGNRYIGELIDQVYEVDAGALVAQVSGGGTRSATAYRMLRSATAAGGYYRPERHTGPRIYVRWTGTGDQAGFRVASTESFFRAVGFALICEDPQEVTGGNKDGWLIEGDDFVGSRLFTRISEGGLRQTGTPTAPFFICYHVNYSAGSADRARFLNCIAYGSRYFRGANTGFVFDVFSSLGGCYNCAAYSMTRGNTARGYLAVTPSGAKPQLVNCVAVDCYGNDFSGAWESIALDPTNPTDPLSVDEPYQCAGTDYSLPFELGNPRASANLNGIDGRTIFGRPEVQDMRPTTGSTILNKGRDMSLVWIALGLTPEDFDGVVRATGATGYLSIGWNIGPYETTSALLATTAPTVEVKSIGSAGGRDYATIQAFLDATDDQSLAYQNKVVVGELYADSTFSITAGQRVIARRTITDARHYRMIRPAADQAYDFVSQFGVKITGDGGSTTGENNLVEVHEDFFRIGGPILMECTYSSTANRRVLKTNGDSVRVDGVYGKFVASTGSFSSIFLLRGSRNLVTNCVAIGSGTSNVGAGTGFSIQNCERTRVYCSVAHRITGAGGGAGFSENSNTARAEFSSCIAADCTNGFVHITSGNAPKVQSYCTSTDSSADGIGAITGATAAALFKSPTTGDYRNAPGSSSIKSGRNLSPRFSIDFYGTQRIAPFDRGAFEGLPPGPLFPAPVFAESRAFMTLWQLRRKDGVVLLFTDANEPIVYRGLTYSVSGGVIASNRRDETESKSVGVRGALVSSKITAEDLAAQRYRGARLREIVLGRYAWTEPIEENEYVLGDVRFDANEWSTDVSSLSSLLEKNAGRLITIGCPLRLGNSECGVDLTLNTLDDVRVSATIDDPRRKFDANSADVPGSGTYADDYFTKGEVFFLSGAATGLRRQVKKYTAANRTIELEEALPYDVEEDDTFILYPGCMKLYVASCITQHSNGINYGGEPFMSGTDKSLSTPQ